MKLSLPCHIMSRAGTELMEQSAVDNNNASRNYINASCKILMQSVCSPSRSGVSKYVHSLGLTLGSAEFRTPQIDLDFLFKLLVLSF